MSFDPNHPEPRVSVGLLLRNGGAVFRKVIEALANQEAPWPFEIVALDSGSRDGSDRFASGQGVRVIAYRPEGKYRFGPARDRLFEECRGEVIVTLSADVIPASANWLAKLTAPIFEGRAEATVGEQVPPPGEYAFYWDYHGSWMRSVAVRFDEAHGRVAISCANLAIKRSVWQELRFGEAEAIEDRALQVKLHQRGHRMAQVKDALSYHGHDYTWQALRSRTESFAMGWAQLGWPYTLKRLVRDLVQPSRYTATAQAFIKRELRSWKELAYPLAMCFMQYRGSRFGERKKSGQWSVGSGQDSGPRPLAHLTTDHHPLATTPLMKIAYLAAGFPVLSETFVVNDIRGLESLGHDVTAVALGPADPATAGNPNYAIRGRTVRVRGLGKPPWRKVEKLVGRARMTIRHGSVFKHKFNERPEGIPDELWRDRLAWDAAIEQIDRAGPFDFLYVHFAMRQLLLGYHASRVLCIPLAVTLQAHDIFTNPLTKFFPQLLGQCAFVVTVSQYNKEAILKLAPNLDPEKVHVLANGIDVHRFKPRWHEPHRPFRFAGTGRLVEIKGFHVLVEAAGLLAARGRKDFTVHLVGEGPLRGHIEQRIRALGIADQFILLGKRDASFLEQWLPEQDCFVLPCVIAKDGNRDGMPLALREGMACGLPALSTQLLGLHETVAPGTGLLVNADDPSALADGMEQLICLSAPKHRQMAEAARFRAESEFSLEREVGMLSTWMEEARQAPTGASASAKGGRVSDSTTELAASGPRA